MKSEAREKAWRELNINEWRLKLRSTTDQKKAAELLDQMFDAGVAHATQWVRISESGLPEEGQTVAFIVESSDKYSNGLVLGGRYKDGYFNVPGCGYQASHWMPLPPPCEIESKTEARLKEIRSVKHGSSKDVLVGGEK